MVVIVVVAATLAFVADRGSPSAGPSNKGSGATTSSTTLPTTGWEGTSGPCKVQLPEPKDVASYGSFHTCPPKHILLIGDSVALTMGIEMVLDEERYGVLLDNRTTLGCGFVTGDEVNLTGSFTPMSRQCTSEGATWSAAAKNFKPQAVVVEMGWRDSMEHKVNGATVDLSSTSYRNLVLSKMEALVTALRSVTSAPVYFLTVPWMQPPKWANGQANPAASTASHAEINSLLAEAVAKSKDAHLINVSPYITPTGHFDLDVHGSPCRQATGVNMYTQRTGSAAYVSTACGLALQEGVLSTIRKGISAKS